MPLWPTLRIKNSRSQFGCVTRKNIIKKLIVKIGKFYIYCPLPPILGYVLWGGVANLLCICFAFALLCFCIALLCFALQTGAFPQGVAHVKIKKTLATPQTRVPSSLLRVWKARCCNQLESSSSMCTWWILDALHKCLCISGPLSRRPQMGGEMRSRHIPCGWVHTSFVVLLLESRSRWRSLAKSSQWHFPRTFSRTHEHYYRQQRRKTQKQQQALWRRFSLEMFGQIRRPRSQCTIPMYCKFSLSTLPNCGTPMFTCEKRVGAPGGALMSPRPRVRSS
jgi:hypothetical protein